MLLVSKIGVSLSWVKGFLIDDILMEICKLIMWLDNFVFNEDGYLWCFGYWVFEYWGVRGKVMERVGVMCYCVNV